MSRAAPASATSLGASLHDVGRAIRPVALAREQVVPVLPALSTLVPDGGLVRGSVTVVEGAGAATSLGLALLAGPSAAGSWIVVVGRPDLGLAAAAEAGVALERLALVAEPEPGDWAGVVAALVGAVDLVVVGPTHRVRTADARRLAARARERGTVLVHLPPARGRDQRRAKGQVGHEADLRLTVVESRWQGVGQGHGHVQARRISVEVGGRRRADRTRRVELWCPDPRGAITLAAPSSESGHQKDRNARTQMPGLPERSAERLVG